MKKRLISILGKFPNEKGRVGSKEEQDWYRSCVLLSEEMKRDGHALALIVSDFSFDGEHEMNHYHGTLRKLGVCEKRIISVKEGCETIHQLKRSAEEAERRKCELWLVVVDIHEERCRALCSHMGIDAKFLVAEGIPRPGDATREKILRPIYPLFRWRWFRNLFQRITIRRRKRGKY